MTSPRESTGDIIKPISKVVIFLLLGKRGGGFPGGSVVKTPSANAGDARDVGSISGSGRSLGRGNGHPLQYSCLENPMERRVWKATVHGVAKSQMGLRD